MEKMHHGRKVQRLALKAMLPLWLWCCNSFLGACCATTSAGGVGDEWTREVTSWLGEKILIR